MKTTLRVLVLLAIIGISVPNFELPIPTPQVPGITVG